MTIYYGPWKEKIEVLRIEREPQDDPYTKFFNRVSVSPKFISSSASKFKLSRLTLTDRSAFTVQRFRIAA